MASASPLLTVSGTVLSRRDVAVRPRLDETTGETRPGYSYVELDLSVPEAAYERRRAEGLAAVLTVQLDAEESPRFPAAAGDRVTCKVTAGLNWRRYGRQVTRVVVYRLVEMERHAAVPAAAAPAGPRAVAS